MAEKLKVDFRATVAQLLDHEIGARLLALATPQQLMELAREIAQADLFQFPSVINAAAQFILGDLLSEDFVARHLEHLVWVEHRRAVWQSGRIRSLREVGCELK